MGVEKNILLIEYMRKKDRPVTAKELADSMNVSVRTVKNYISLINKEAKTNVIMSSFMGYEVNTAEAEVYLKKLEKQNISVPQTYEERADFINRSFLVGHTDCLNLYDIAEALNFSMETVKSDIVKMNKSFSSMGISYEIHSDSVYLHARESALRKLARYTLFSREREQMINYAAIKTEFLELDVEAIKSIWEKVLEKYDFYVNDFGMVNMVLHVAIIIRRMKNGKLLAVSPDIQFDKSCIEYEAILETCERLELLFEIKFNEQEKANLYLLFKANANVVAHKDSNDFQAYIGLELLTFVEKLVEDLDRKYYVDLKNEKFLLPFSLHIKNLIFRMNNQQSMVNPMCEIIRYSHPMIFDMAVSVSHALGKEFGMIIDENEISYLALHIGGEIERQELNYEKIRTLLLCPDYLGFASKMYNQILLSFSNDIELLACVSTSDQIEKYQFELLITTEELQKNSERYEIVYIPFLGIQRYRSQIEESLQLIKEKRRMLTLKKEFKRFFHEDLFWVDKSSELKKEEVMKLMADQMIRKGVVRSDYYERLLERERAASTGFPNIAVPHSMRMDAIETSIGIMFCPKGMKWGNQRVKLVLAVAVQEMDGKLFGDLYQALIQIFDNEKNLRLLLKAETFQQFLKMMESLI